MRGIIVEIRGARAAALGTDGSVHKMKNHRYALGRAVVYVRKKRSRRMIAWAVCAAVLGAAGSASVYAAYEPYSYVSVDGAASVSYTLNRFDQVIGMETCGDETGALGQDLSGRVCSFFPIEQALGETLDSMTETGQLDENAADAALISVAAKENYKAVQMKEHLGKALGEENGAAPPARVVSVSREEWMQQYGGPHDGHPPKKHIETPPPATQPASEQTE